ncbi:MAG: methyltransferase domain-containing protein [Elusimicrobiota bacterium]
MDKNILPQLACPACQGPLAAGIQETRDGRIISGSLECGRCRCKFPIIRGIARFVENESYVESFGYEWKDLFEWRTETDRDFREEEEIFRVKTGWTPEALRGRLVLDAGCGSGRYATVAARWGARVVAVDMSLAVEKAKKICENQDVSIIQADIMKLPFKNCSFDAAYSIGVLHHTGGTKNAFLRVAERVKPGGSLGAWFYRKNTALQEWLNSALRARTTKLPRESLIKFSKALARVAGIPGLNAALGRIINLGCTHPDFNRRFVDAFDWYSPTYQWHHTPEEVRSWFIEAGFEEIRELRPQKSGRIYDWTYRHNLLIGSGVNFLGLNKQNDKSE